MPAEIFDSAEILVPELVPETVRKAMYQLERYGL